MFLWNSEPLEQIFVHNKRQFLGLMLRGKPCVVVGPRGFQDVLDIWDFRDGNIRLFCEKPVALVNVFAVVHAEQCHPAVTIGVEHAVVAGAEPVHVADVAVELFLLVAVRRGVLREDGSFLQDLHDPFFGNGEKLVGESRFVDEFETHKPKTSSTSCSNRLESMPPCSSSRVITRVPLEPSPSSRGRMS